MSPSKVIIKKYENRRLYDSTNSRYVNLEEVAEMLRQGVDVEAVDAATGEDITRLILTQIIVDGAKDRDSGFPLDVLRQMVVATGRASQETLLRNTRALLEVYQNAYGAFTPAITPLDFMQKMMKSETRTKPPAAPVRETTPPPAATQADAEVNDLRRRINELEQMVHVVARKRGERKPAKKSVKKAAVKKPRR
jgi:polyhydroxyalkanoate synthesis repressor PhaR